MLTILAPTDFSPDSEKAERYALELAVHCGKMVRLLLLHTYPIPQAHPDGIIDRLDACRWNSLRKLEQRTYQMQNTNGGRHRVSIEPLSCMGSLLNIIHYGISAHNVDYIVTGIKIDKAWQELKRPILSIPRRAAFNGAGKVGTVCTSPASPDSLTARALELFAGKTRPRVCEMDGVPDKARLEKQGIDVLVMAGEYPPDHVRSAGIPVLWIPSTCWTDALVDGSLKEPRADLGHPEE